MSEAGFVSLLVVGAALLAVWFDLRFEQRRPEAPVRRVGHGIAAYVALQAGTAAFAYLGKPEAPLGQRLAALFLLFLPGLVYAFLTGLWLVRTAADLARLVRR
jgi:hypothetical protein